MLRDLGNITLGYLLLNIVFWIFERGTGVDLPPLAFVVGGFLVGITYRGWGPKLPWYQKNNLFADPEDE